jgi:hypothetical protein
MPRRLLLFAIALTVGLPSAFACTMETPSSAQPSGVLTASPDAETRLGSSPVTLTLPSPPEERVAAVAEQGGHLRLVIEGIQVLHPGAVYQVYLNLPPGKAPDPGGPYFVGNLSLYTEPGQTPDITRTYDVTEQVKALRRTGEWKGPVRLTFVRERLGQEPSASVPPAFLRFTRVSVVARLSR